MKRILKKAKNRTKIAKSLIKQKLSEKRLRFQAKNSIKSPARTYSKPRPLLKSQKQALLNPRKVYNQDSKQSLRCPKKSRTLT